MTLDELYLVQKAIRYSSSLSLDEYAKADRLIMREIELKVMNPRLSKEEDNRRRNTNG